MAGESRIVRFLLTGDARGALRAQEEAAKGFEKTGKSADESSKHISLFHKSLEGIKNVVGYGSGVLGLAGVAFGIKDVVQSGMQWQQQQAQLRTALKDTGQMSQHAMRQINSAAESSSVHGGFSPLEETAGIAQLVRLTGSYTQAIKLNAAAVNLARGAHIEQAAALKLVARAQAGTAGRAQQYLGIIQPVKTYVDQLTEAQKKQNPELLKHAELLDKQATAQEINRVVMEKYAGATKAYSKTAAGALSNFKHLVDIITERLGQKLLPLVAKVAGAMSTAAQWVIAHWSKIGAVFKTVFEVVVHSLPIYYIAQFVKWLVKNRQVAEALAIGIAAVAGPIVAYNAVMTLATAVTTAWGAALEFAADMLFLLTSPISLIVIGLVALAAGVAYAYLHFKTFREVVNAVFGAVKLAVLEAVNFIGEHWRLLLAIFALPLLPVVEVVRNFSKVKSAIESVFGGIGSFVSGVFDGIVSVVQGAINLIIKAINVMIAGYNAVQKNLPFGLGAAQIKPLAELGAKPSAAAAPIHHPGGGGGGSHVAHVHLHLGTGAAKEIASALIKDRWAARALAESHTHVTLVRHARA